MSIQKITPVPYQPQKVTFKGGKSADNSANYISPRTQSHMTLGALLAMTVGQLVATTAGVMKILKVDRQAENFGQAINTAFKASSPGRKFAAIATFLGGVIIPTFLTTKIIANRNKNPEEKLSNTTIAKITGAAIGGTAAGRVAGNMLTSKLANNGSVFSVILGALITVLGLEAAVSWVVKKNNQKVPREKVFNNAYVVSRQDNAVVIQDFQSFINRSGLQR
jgi:hypothetical protein